MTDLEKYEMVNKCETQQELLDAIVALGDENGEIQGRSRKFSVEKMVKQTKQYFEDQHNIPNVLTREFGLRQQAMYIKYYES